MGQEFLDLLTTRYGSELRDVDFATQTETARQTINRWVEEQTQEKIKDLIAPGMLDPVTRLVLTNAIYFKGTWRSPFENDRAHPAPFTGKSGRFSGDTAEVSMMTQTESFGYLNANDFQALELPYEGEALSMVIFLPQRVNGLKDFERSLISDTLAARLPRLRIQEVEVFLPKFKMTSEFQLGGILRSLGMTDAFALETADFSGMTDREKVSITDVVHKAFVEVNEEGTEAAAATATDAAGCAEPAPDPDLPRGSPLHVPDSGCSFGEHFVHGARGRSPRA